VQFRRAELQQKQELVLQLAMRVKRSATNAQDSSQKRSRHEVGEQVGAFLSGLCGVTPDNGPQSGLGCSICIKRFAHIPILAYCRPAGGLVLRTDTDTVWAPAATHKGSDSCENAVLGRQPQPARCCREGALAGKLSKCRGDSGSLSSALAASLLEPA
jgi:hypothetical protein